MTILAAAAIAPLPSGRAEGVMMAALRSVSEELWQEIDASESYLVSCMFEEAASRASSVIRDTHTTTEEIGETELAEMRESAGMVFVQSLKELGRTSELFIELQMLFGSVAAIPVQLFLTGVCMQISEGLSSNLQAIFKEFLGKWTYLDGESYILPEGKPQNSSEGNIRPSVMHADKYVEVSEVYAITFLGIVLRNPGLAISWTENAVLPEENRQDMLRKLRSLHFTTESSPSLGVGSSQVTGRISDPSPSGNGSASSFREGFLKTTKPQCHPNGDKLKSTTSKSFLPTIERISDRIDPSFLRWFRTIRIRYGNAQLVIPRGKTMLLGLLMFLAYSIVRKRSAALKRTVTRQALSVKRVVSDAWQLAFSVNVNPLAAVHQLPSAPRGSR